MPTDDVIVHWRGPDCPCNPMVIFGPHELQPSDANVTETWVHRRLPQPQKPGKTRGST